MKTILLLHLAVFLSLASVSQGVRNETPKSILEKVRRVYEGHRSISYDVDYKIKYLTDDDTTRLKAKCNLIRDPKDSLFNGYVWYITDSRESYYDLKRIYVTDHNRKLITEYSEDYPITGHTSGEVINIFFLRPKVLSNIVKDPDIRSVTLKHSSTHYLIEIKYKDAEGVSGAVRNISVRKIDNLIDKISFKAKFGGNYQFNEWRLYNILFDKTTPADLSESFMKSREIYAYKTEASQEEEDVPPLDTGAVAPIFEGLLFPENSLVRLTDFDKPVKLIDFFYMACLPCIKSIPELVKLHEEFGNKGLVILGVNSVDTAKNQYYKLRNFIVNNGIRYPVILTDGSVDKAYKVNGYPTLYLLNRENEVIFTASGYSKALGDKLRQIIEMELKASGSVEHKN